MGAARTSLPARRALRFAGLAGLTVFALLAAGAAAADASPDVVGLIERNPPFEVPDTLMFPSGYVADAALDDRGDVHAVISTAGAAFYLRLNGTTGEVLEQVNLTEKGFGIDVFDYSNAYYGYSSGYDFRFAVITVYGSKVAIAHPFSFAGADVMIFERGHAADGSLQRLLYPPAPVTGYYWYVSGFALMENAADPSRPSLAWSRTQSGSSSYSYYYGNLEIGRIDLDLRAGTVGAPYSVRYLQNATMTYTDSSTYSGSGTDYFDGWRTWYQFSNIAGAIDADGGAWIFFLGNFYVCNYWYTYYNYCDSYTVFNNWSVLDPTAQVRPLSSLNGGSNYYYYYYWSTWGSASAATAPDGSVAAFFIEGPGGADRLFFARARGSTLTSGNITIGSSIRTGSSAVAVGGGVDVVVTDMVNGSTKPLGRTRVYTGWPDDLHEVAVATSPYPLERPNLFGGAAGEWSLFAGSLRDAVNASEVANRGTTAGASFGRTWPVLWTVHTGSPPLLDIQTWDEVVPAPVLYANIVPLKGGGLVGVITTIENGTGVVRVLSAAGPSSPFTLTPTIDVFGAAIEARIVPDGDGALAVVQVRYPHPAYYGSSSAATTGYVFFSISASGAVGAARNVYGLAHSPSEQSFTRDWRLMSAEPLPLLYTYQGVYSLDGLRGIAVHSIAFYSYYYYYYSNMTRVLDQTREALVYGGNSWYYGCSATGSPSSGCLPLVDAWTEGNETYLAVLPYNSTYGYPYCNCTPMLRVVKWQGGGSAVWYNQSLRTGHANDTMYFSFNAEITHRFLGGGSTEIWVTLREYGMWERTYRAVFSSTEGRFTASALVREDLQASMGVWTGMFSLLPDGVALLRASDDYFYYGGTPYSTDLRSSLTFNGTDSTNYIFAPKTKCESSGYYWPYYYYYYYPYSYYGYYFGGCNAWTAMPRANGIGVLLVDDGVPRYFAPNHPPVGPRLLAPENGSMVNSTHVRLTSLAAFDPDGDRLSYTFTVYDKDGLLVARADAYDPTVEVVLFDGKYTWTVSVSDTVFSAASPDLFTFIIDGTPPVARPGGPYTVRPGGTVHFDGSASDDQSGVVAWSWAMGDPEDNGTTRGGVAPTLTWDELAPLFGRAPVFSVRLTVTDSGGLSASADTLVVLLDSAVVIDATLLTGSPVEGTKIEAGVNVTWGDISLSWMDPETLERSFTIVWKLPDGGGTTGARASWNALDSGKVKVEVTAVSGSGTFGYASFEFLVDNLPPLVAGEGPEQLAEGDLGTYRLNTTDPSPIDAASLTVSWAAADGLELVDHAGFSARVRALANGVGHLTATVRDKDGGETRFTFAVRIAEAALAVPAAWVAAVGSTWADLRWQPTPESDFESYEIVVRGPDGAIVRRFMLPGATRESDRAIVGDLTPATTYEFGVVVVAIGGARSAPATASATTSPESVSPPPPDPNLGLPQVGGRAVVETGGAPAYVWLLVAIGAASGAAYLLVSRRRPRDD